MNINIIIKERLEKLEKSNKKFSDIFEIIHSNEEFLFAEKTNGYKIEKTTYGECKKYCYQMAQYLSHKINSPKHSFVGLMMDNSVEFINTFFGLLMLGYKPMLLNIRLGSELNNQIIKRLNIEYVVTDNDYVVDSQIINIKNCDYKNLNTDSLVIDWENEMAISTSATSLNVKICVYDGESISEQIKNSDYICKTNSFIKKHHKGYIKQLAFLPFYHIFGLMATYFWFSFFGRSFVFLKDLSSDTIIKTIKKHEVTHIFAVPMLWHTVYKTLIKNVEKEDEKTVKKFYKGLALSNKLQSICPTLGKKIASNLFREVLEKAFGKSIKFMISGGSYIKQDTVYTLNGIGYPLFNGYGMSEIGITSVELSKKASYRNKCSIGKPFPTVEYKINEDNHLLVRSKGLCKKIITMTEEMDINKDEWFDTSDIASVDSTGRYYIEGRVDDIVLTESGEKINPDIIEKKLSFSVIEKYSVMGLKKNDKYELSLILEIKGNLNQNKIDKLIEEVDQNIQSLEYHIDNIYYTFDAITSPTAIKVSRKILNKWIESKKVSLIPFSEIKNSISYDEAGLNEEISKRVIKLFSEILMVEEDKIGKKDHFIFDLGGTSLDYFTLLMKINEEFGISIDNTVNSCYTVFDITKFITNNMN